jgi:hypothetical protein
MTATLQHVTIESLKRECLLRGWLEAKNWEFLFSFIGDFKPCRLESEEDQSSSFRERSRWETCSISIVVPTIFEKIFKFIVVPEN